MIDLWIAIVGGLSVAVPSVIATIVSNQGNKKLIIYRIDKLEEQVQKNENLDDRVHSIEKDIVVLQEDVKEIKSAI